MRIKVTAIVPKMDDDWPISEKEIKAALSSAGKVVEQTLKRPTGTWSSPVRFAKKAEDFAVEIYTTDKRFVFVDAGTRPHTITPKRSPLLAFRSEYVAKTTPRVPDPRPGRSGGQMVFAKSVQHPGIQAREFTLVARRYGQKVLSNKLGGKK
ncbi:MAG: hypothetical protein D6706_21000 [Chloroflexi bacterium]|nr:MAG: hypothetical protein D6706_21000 [Chloroflexota bacterium]